MSDLQYIFDSSPLVGWRRRQPPEIYVKLWDNLEEMLRGGVAGVPAEAVEELKRGTDGLADWVKDCDAVVQATDRVIDIVGQISKAHPGWVADTQNAADPWIVATASATGAAIVTDERRRGPGVRDPNLGIPNVADEWKVECLDLVTFQVRMNWTF
jgi:hypothetical protein